MSDNDLAEQDLLRLIEQGVADSAKKLAAVSRTEWNTQTVSIRSAALERFQDAMASVEKEQFASYFTMPGGVFLVMFPLRSGTAFADVFLPADGRRADIQNREQECLAEISNVVVNTVAATIADSCDTAFFLSSPKTAQGKKKDLLAAAPSMFSASGEKFTIMAYVHMSSASLSSDCTIVLLLSAAWKERLLAAL